jgi:hypothetical protein
VVVIDDVANQPHLTAAELAQLQRIIEAGLLARDARLSGAGFADATKEELSLLEDQGALARQRFIQANLGLVGMVSRQFAARCQLPDAELFQEGCLGLPACQLPTGSSLCTSLSANSSIICAAMSATIAAFLRPRPAGWPAWGDKPPTDRIGQGVDQQVSEEPQVQIDDGGRPASR